MAASDPQLLWITSRAAGTTAIVCASAATALGLTLGGRLARAPGLATKLRVAHETLALAALAALLVHGVTLVLDPWLRTDLAGVLVPFTTPYRPFFTGLGILAAYGMVLFGLMPYLRRRLSDRWAALHRLTAVAWALGTVHVLGSGSDVTEPWMVSLLVACVLPVLALLALRLHTARPHLFTPPMPHQET